MNKQILKKFKNTINRITLPDAVALRMQKMIKGISLSDEDTEYKKEFENSIGPEIYRLHLGEYFICCAFCSHLVKSSCHEYCFKCSRRAYAECSYLLPGTFSFAASNTESPGNLPWIFKTPCSEFERLNDKKYFKHFTSLSQEVTVSNYEVLEGIFTGLSRGKKPCHVCASVNMDICSKCSDQAHDSDDHNCNRIIEEIASRYRAIPGIIKYI